mmetsp:Transcript_35100/g.58131  ORF Transcript_35100/g.58131 Transcript_35100/m.58131 type:complete len:179 (+) Transcript_35100:68-604(+)
MNLMWKGDNDGVDKLDFFKKLNEQRRPDMSTEDKMARLKGLVDAWAADGLDLTSPFGVSVKALKQGQLKADGRWGNSFNAQRLIWLARQQGREHAMIEEVYQANHKCNNSLSDWNVLTEAARKAGVKGASDLLNSSTGVSEASDDSSERLILGKIPVVSTESISESIRADSTQGDLSH